MLKPVPIAAAQSATRNANVNRPIEGSIPAVLLSFSASSQAAPRLDWLDALIAAATDPGSIVSASAFVLWPPIRSQKPVSG